MKKFFRFLINIVAIGLFVFGTLWAVCDISVAGSDYQSNPIVDFLERRRLTHIIRNYVDKNMPLSYLYGKERTERVEELTTALVNVQMNGYGTGYWGCWIGGEICANTNFVDVRDVDIYNKYSDYQLNKVARNLTTEEQKRSLELANAVMYECNFINGIIATIYG